jgi:hypothetical protein
MGTILGCSTRFQVGLVILFLQMIFQRLGAFNFKDDINFDPSKFLNDIYIEQSRMKILNGTSKLALQLIKNASK